MKRIVIALILGFINCFVNAQETVANESPYALFGDSTKTLKASIHYQSDGLCIPVLLKDSTQAKIFFDFQQMTVKLIDEKGEVLAVDTLNEMQRGRFISIDPNAEDYYHISPYAYCINNPINAVDPDGRSTWIIYQGNGQYQIAGGDINDKDRNIYVGYFNDLNIFVPQRSIGITSSITSFYNSDPNGGGWQKGSIIDVNDKSGDQFLSSIIGNNPPMFDDYMMNARNNHPYDFKVTNGTGEKYGKNMYYRGMPIGINGNGQIIYTSARDVGNIAAGYVAAVNGMSWEASRIAFDMYQGEIEGVSTRNAEYYGWKMGYNNTTNNQKADNLMRSFGSMFHSIWDYIFK